jgi:hypothetical protein
LNPAPGTLGQWFAQLQAKPETLNTKQEYWPITLNQNP